MFVRLNNAIVNMNNIVYIEVNRKIGIHIIVMCNDSEIYINDDEFKILIDAIKRMNNESNISN